MGKNYRQQSRDVQWGTTSDTPGLTLEQVNCGSLLRIADATELMAQRYQQLIDERDRYIRWYNENLDRCTALERIIAALRGVITKMKKNRPRPRPRPVARKKIVPGILKRHPKAKRGR